jgi:hypothetical protein
MVPSEAIAGEDSRALKAPGILNFHFCEPSKFNA